MEETHYYPFGLTMAGISSKALNNVVENKYKFNGGSELNSTFDVNIYETLFRGYDYQTGRFHQIDPLAEITPSWGAYAFVQNNPLLYSDPFGLDTLINNEIYQWDGGYMDEIIINMPSSGGGDGFFGFGWGSGTGQSGQQGNMFSDPGMTASGGGNGQGLQSSGGDNGSVGQPGFGESLIPVWGAGRSAIDHFQNGNYWRGIGYTALTISDVFLVKSIVTGIGRGAWKLGSHSWGSTRKWAVNKGYAGAGEPLHHWAITQATAKEYGIEAIANQPWNLTKFSSQVSHMRWAHGTAYPSVGLGTIPGWQFLYPISSTPIWFKATLFSTGGRIID